MTRSASSQISFADLEFLNQGIRLEPMLQAISNFIDQHGLIVDTHKFPDHIHDFAVLPPSQIPAPT